MDGDASWREVCRETGRAVGALTQVPLSASDRAAFEAQFYLGIATLEQYIQRILELGWSIHTLDPDFRGAFWENTLAFIETHKTSLLAQPRMLYHQDVGNLHVQHNRFIGFFDVEMCRIGCAAMQLGSALGLVGGDGNTVHRMGWEPFREGWEEATDAFLTSANRHATMAASYLLQWREISRYLSYDGTPGTGFDWASPADPVQYRGNMEAVAEMLAVSLTT